MVRVPDRTDVDAIARALDAEHPVPTALTHVEEIDVSGLVHRYVR